MGAVLAALCGFNAHADKSTVCTVTVNSPDEKEILRRSLPEENFQFVELVERGRPDWLASACRQGVHCDVLVVSGHFDGGTEFYSDRVDVRESLPVEGLERASCSDSCSGLFSRLKEVYLFGCNTLNAATGESTAAEVARSLVRSGQSPEDADRVSRNLNAVHGESNREAIRRIFANVPVIYGFPSKAPLGATAGPLLGRYLQATAGGEFGSGRASASLLNHFSASAMTAAVGQSDSDPRAGYRREVCQFFDAGQTAAQKLAFIHRLLRRDMAEVRMFFERIETFHASLTEQERQAPSFVRELEAIARDDVARDRYLAFVRDIDRPEIRVRMMQMARKLGWLSPENEKVEIARTVTDILVATSLSSAEADLVCTLNEDRNLEGELQTLQLAPSQASKLTHSAALACLGHAEARARVLQALTGRDVEDVGVAQVYLRHRPITDVNELRVIAARIARMTDAAAQIRALDTLAHYYLSDQESLDELTRLFQRARSVSVQRAIAGVLIRSDYRAIAPLDLVRVLRQHRLKSPDGEDLIDVLIRRLQV